MRVELYWLKTRLLAVEKFVLEIKAVDVMKQLHIVLTAGVFVSNSSQLSDQRIQFAPEHDIRVNSFLCFLGFLRVFRFIGLFFEFFIFLCHSIHSVPSTGARSSCLGQLLSQEKMVPA